MAPEATRRPRQRPKIRELTAADLAAVVRIDAHHTGTDKRAYWQRIFRAFLGREHRGTSMALGVDGEDGLAGYLFGEVRAVEFGAEECGWVFAVGVEPGLQRSGIASALLQEAARRFARAGVRLVRTMVRRTDVPVLSFFRANGFVGGAFVQLELDLTGG